MKIKNVMVYTGYVESSSWSALMFSHEDGFDSVEAALHHLGECILIGVRLEEKHSYYPPCCRENMEKAERFCGKCGQNLEKRAVDREKLAQVIVGLRSGDNDSNGYEIWEVLASNGWELWGKLGKGGNDFTNVVVLSEYGEYTLADAAFGRMFDVAPTNDEYYKPEPKSEKERRKDCKDKYRVFAPQGAKFFLDD